MGRRLVLLELNEINWGVAEPLIRRNKLPNLARTMQEGAFGAPEARERYPHLDPWVTWVTLHTGVDQSEHQATVLEQDQATISAKRSWEWVVEAGKSIGVFGSIGAYPPRPVPGFIVPGPFAPGDETFPAELRPIQAVNRLYTRLHGNAAHGVLQRGTARSLMALFQLGLTPRTFLRIVSQLAHEKAKPAVKWKRVALQPLVNFDVFSHLYRRHRPDFATWHTNHAAHYMHHYWRAYDDAGFPRPSPPEEKRTYGNAVAYGYELCDELIGRCRAMIDSSTVLVIASSMGQQPYVAEAYPEGRYIVRFRDVRKLLDVIGAQGVTEIVPIMVPQVNLRVPNPFERRRVQTLLRAARRIGGPHPGALNVEETGEILTVGPSGLAERTTDVRYHFPGSPHDRPEGYPLDELFAVDAPTAKQGMHHPRGMLVMHGPGIRRGVELTDAGALDIAPTMLHLLGIPVPSVMKGRVLTEALGGPPPKTDGRPDDERTDDRQTAYAS